MPKWVCKIFEFIKDLLGVIFDTIGAAVESLLDGVLGGIGRGLGFGGGTFGKIMAIAVIALLLWLLWPIISSALRGGKRAAQASVNPLGGIHVK